MSTKDDQEVRSLVEQLEKAHAEVWAALNAKIATMQQFFFTSYVQRLEHLTKLRARLLGLEDAAKRDRSAAIEDAKFTLNPPSPKIDLHLHLTKSSAE